MILEKSIIFNTFILQLIMLIIEYGNLEKKKSVIFLMKFFLKLISTKNIT